MSTIELPAEPTSPAAARRFVADSLAPVVGVPVDIATLLVSELVTNAVLHARTAMVVTVTAADGSVRVGVQDGSAALPALRQYDRTAPTGRGLQMLERLASRWGVETDETSKTVWFELLVACDRDLGTAAASSVPDRRRDVAARPNRPGRSPPARPSGQPEGSRPSARRP